MKVFCSILITLCSLSTYSQSPFEWPEDLQVDPADYSLKELKVKKVTQYKRYGNSWKFADSTEQNQWYIDYIVEYDSLSRIQAFKYKFLNHVRYYHFFGDSLKIDSLRIVSEQNETPLLFIKLNDQWLVKNYWEVRFIYDDYRLANMKILDPYLRFGISNVLDGIYIKESNQAEILTKYYYNYLGELIKEKGFSGDTLLYENSYEYVTFESQGKSARLLTQSVIHGVIYNLEYEFY